MEGVPTRYLLEDVTSLFLRELYTCRAGHVVEEKCNNRRLRRVSIVKARKGAVERKENDMKRSDRSWVMSSRDPEAIVSGPSREVHHG